MFMVNRLRVETIVSLNVKVVRFSTKTLKVESLVKCSTTVNVLGDTDSAAGAELSELKSLPHSFKVNCILLLRQGVGPTGRNKMCSSPAAGVTVK